MTTKFPPPPEIVTHPLGYLCYSCKPWKDRKKTGWNIVLHSTAWPWNRHGARGEVGESSCGVLERAIAEATARQLEYGYDQQIGFVPEDQRTAWRKKNWTK